MSAACRAARAALVAGQMLVAADAGAHSFEPALLDLREREAGVFDVVWRAPEDEARIKAPEAAIRPGLPDACRVVATTDTGASDDEVTFFRVACGAGRLRGERITLHGIAGSRIDAMVRVTWNDGTAATGVLRTDVEDFAVPGDPDAGALATGAPAATVAWRYLRLGVHHILLGFDHLLFVAALFLLVGATRALIATITAFTLAHSLTLALAVLDVVRVPLAPVEALIALSIVFLARELVRGPEEPATLTRRAPWVIAFAFGLLHGLGFAGALAETGVPSDQVPLALLAFNLGVEAGQLAVVGLLILAAAAGSRVLPATGRLRPWPAYAIGGIAAAWTLERVAGFWPGR